MRDSGFLRLNLRRFLVIAGVWFYAQLAIFALHDVPTFGQELYGTDSYMRLVRLEALLESGDW